MVTIEAVDGAWPAVRSLLSRYRIRDLASAVS
jgi:hypothetical protein